MAVVDMDSPRRWTLEPFQVVVVEQKEQILWYIKCFAFVFEHHFQPNGCHGRPFEVPEVAIEAELENLEET